MGSGKAYNSSDHAMLRTKYMGSNQCLSSVDQKLIGLGITGDDK
jgi:hypothetical protein